MPKNTVDLSNLPRKGKLMDWKSAHHLPVPFHYRGVDDVFYIEKDIDADHVLVSYQNKEYELSKVSVVRVALGKLFGFASANNYKYEVGDIIDHQTKASIKILKQIRSDSICVKNGVKAYEVECLDCHSVFEIREGNLSKGDRCPYCSNHKVKKGFNDIAHTNPELVKYFVNSEDATKYVLKSNKYVEAVCPNCNTLLGKRQIYELLRHNVRCPMCGKGSSYPNRFMFNLLTKLCVKVQTEATFDWCLFPDYNDSSMLIRGRYDFLCVDYSTIIEVDSGLGHGNNIHSKANISREESMYRDIQKEKLANEHGYNMIRIECAYYGHQNRFLAVKQGILNSKFSSVFDLSKVNWNQLDEMSQSSLLRDICDVYNEGYSLPKIAEMFGLTVETIRVYLHKGEDCGLCVYGRKRKIS